MKRYLLDSNAVSDFVAKRLPFAAHARAARLAGCRLGTCVPVLAELYYGAERSSTRERNMQRLRHALAELTVWPFDEPAAAEFGRIRAELRRRGRPMQVIDVMIAAVAMRLGNCTVVTTDSDLSAVPGLSVVNWRLAS